MRKMMMLGSLAVCFTLAIVLLAACGSSKKEFTVKVETGAAVTFAFWNHATEHVDANKVEVAATGTKFEEGTELWVTWQNPATAGTTHTLTITGLGAAPTSPAKITVSADVTINATLTANVLGAAAIDGMWLDKEVEDYHVYSAGWTTLTGAAKANGTGDNAGVVVFTVENGYNIATDRFQLKLDAFFADKGIPVSFTRAIGANAAADGYILEIVTNTGDVDTNLWREHGDEEDEVGAVRSTFTGPWLFLAEEDSVRDTVTYVSAFDTVHEYKFTFANGEIWTLRVMVVEAEAEEECECECEDDCEDDCEECCECE